MHDGHFVVFVIWNLIHHECRDDHTQKILGDESTFEFVLFFNASVRQTCDTTKSLTCRIHRKFQSKSKMSKGLVTTNQKLQIIHRLSISILAYWHQIKNDSEKITKEDLVQWSTKRIMKRTPGRIGTCRKITHIHKFVICIFVALLFFCLYIISVVTGIFT